MSDKPAKPSWRPIVLILAVLALLGLGGSTILMSRWTQLDQVDASEARRAFDEALASMADRRPYLEVRDDGTVELHAELEQASEAELETLSVLAFDPKSGRLLRVDFPFWFVRVKLNRALNLGTLTSSLASDWEHLDLDVTETELQKRGAGLVLDESSKTGARLLLWTR